MLGSSRPWWIWLLPGANLVAAAKLGSLSLFRFLLAVILFMVGWSILRATVDVDIAFGIFRLSGLWIIFASLIYGAVVLSEWFRGIGKLMGRPYSVLVWGWIAPVLFALLFLLASVVGVLSLDMALGCAGLMMAYVWLYLIWLAVFAA